MTPGHRPLDHPGATEVARPEQLGLFPVLRQFGVRRRGEKGRGPHQAAQEQGQRGHVVFVQELCVRIIAHPRLDEGLMVQVQELRYG